MSHFLFEVPLKDVHGEPINEKRVLDVLAREGIIASSKSPEPWFEPQPPIAPKDIDLVFCLIDEKPEKTKDWLDNYGVVTAGYHLLITTGQSLPYLADRYTEAERDYIEAALDHLSFSASEDQEGIWEVGAGLEKQIVHNRLLATDGFRFDSQFHQNMLDSDI